MAPPMITAVRHELIATNQYLADLSAHVDPRAPEIWQQEVWQRFRLVVVAVWWSWWPPG